MRLFLAVILVLVIASSCAHAQTGLRIKTVAHFNLSGIRGGLGQTDSTSVIYVQGPRRRAEWSRPTFGQIVTIQRCDTRVSYTLYPEQHEYMESPMPSPDKKENDEDEAKKWGDGPPNLIVEVTTVDTGESKQSFGHTARHYITTTKKIPAPELGQEPGQTVEDSWYLDIPDVMSCEPVSRRPRGLVEGTASTHVGGLVGDTRTLQSVRPEFRYSGPEPQGMLLSSKRTTQAVHVLQNGERQNTEFISSQEIVEIAELPIDPALFEVPPGFMKVEKLTRK